MLLHCGGYKSEWFNWFEISFVTIARTLAYVWPGKNLIICLSLLPKQPVFAHAIVLEFALEMICYRYELSCFRYSAGYLKGHHCG